MATLKHMAEFQKILANYQPSDEAITKLRQSPLVFLTAPSGVGRNTLINQLIKSNKFEMLVSDTTRVPRINDGVLEQNGKEYFFVSEDIFLEGLKKGKYLEAAVIHGIQVSGIRIDTFEAIHRSGKIPISDIEIAGVDYYKRLKHDTICIFVLPPNFDTWMQRLKGRGEMTKDEFYKRMSSAKSELEHALEYGHYLFVINDDITEATKDIEDIVSGKTTKQYTHTRELARELLKAVDQYLATEDVANNNY